MKTDQILEALKGKLEAIFEEPIQTDMNQNFYDIGGNSLTAIGFLDYLLKTFNLELSIKDLFEKNISDIAELVSVKGA